MRTKNNKATRLMIISLLLLTTVASIRFFFSRPPAVALAGTEATPQALPEKSTETAIPQAASPEVLSQTQNDITVEITSAQIIATGVEVGVCYTTLDDGEWYPLPGHLFYGKDEIYPDEIEFLEGEILADGKNTGTRCALIRYLIDDLTTLTTPVEFSILQFYAPFREMYTPCQEIQQRLDTSPKAQAYGLKMMCTETGDGNISVTLVDHDRSVTKDEASKTLDEIAQAEVDGPWEFTINEIER
ncbi:MAG: hypothetical protein EHM40_18170 [Chloroflexi bacterium]|nr:MAG: hypothetical protein EHM40_18170 [Chloroflexota bacterium]